MKPFMITLSTLLIAITFSNYSFGQEDRILGTWLNQDKDAHIKVYKNNGIYEGKIVWIKNDKEDDGSTPNLDNNNPEEELRSRRILGLQILHGLVWDEDDDEWDDGEIYDPKSGNTYSCYAELEDPDTLELRGYIGFSLLGRTSVWTRVK